ncbi:hypothetical protein CSA08_03525, partial [Candidatus Gracilibacteria bacterium]
TQADIDQGNITNQSQVTSKDPSNNDVVDISDNATPSQDIDGDGDNGNDPTIIISSSTPNNSGGIGGGGGGITKDYCPNGDYSSNYNDGTCGVKKDDCPNGDNSPSLYDKTCDSVKDNCSESDYNNSCHDGTCGVKDEAKEPELELKPTDKEEKDNNNVKEKEIIKDIIKDIINITDIELDDLINTKEKSERKYKIAEYIERNKIGIKQEGTVDIGMLNNGIIKYPSILPQTGVQEDIYRKVGFKEIGSVNIKLPNKEIFRLAGNKNTNVDFWLNILPKQDRNKDKYIVIPKEGLIMPINTVSKNDKVYSNFTNGGNENFWKYLETGAVEIPATSLNGYGEVGNKVIAGHSSFYYRSMGRYSTHFQKIILLKPETEIWIYEKNKETGKFDRYVYEVFKSYNTDKKDISVLYPTRIKQLTLFTCTPIGGITGRWIVKAKFIEKK